MCIRDSSEIVGTRYNIGVKYGLLMSQVALALSGKDRDEILTDLLGLVSLSAQSNGQPMLAGVDS